MPQNLVISLHSNENSFDRNYEISSADKTYESYLNGQRYSSKNTNLNNITLKDIPYEEATLQVSDFLINVQITDKT